MTSCALYGLSIFKEKMKKSLSVELVVLFAWQIMKSIFTRQRSINKPQSKRKENIVGLLEACLHISTFYISVEILQTIIIFYIAINRQIRHSMFSVPN